MTNDPQSTQSQGPMDKASALVIGAWSFVGHWSLVAHSSPLQWLRPTGVGAITSVHHSGGCPARRLARPGGDGSDPGYERRGASRGGQQLGSEAAAARRAA